MTTSQWQAIVSFMHNVQFRLQIQAEAQQTLKYFNQWITFHRNTRQQFNNKQVIKSAQSSIGFAFVSLQQQKTC